MSELTIETPADRRSTEEAGGLRRPPRNPPNAPTTPEPPRPPQNHPGCILAYESSPERQSAASASTRGSSVESQYCAAQSLPS